MNINKFLNKKYNENTYNCLHFASEVWEYLTGDNTLINIIPVGEKFVLTKDIINRVHYLEKPNSPCLVYFKNNYSSHIGVYFDNKIIHINKNGVKYELLESAIIGFKKVRFMICF